MSIGFLAANHSAYLVRLDLSIAPFELCVPKLGSTIGLSVSSSAGSTSSKCCYTCFQYAR